MFMRRPLFVFRMLFADSAQVREQLDRSGKEKASELPWLNLNRLLHSLAGSQLFYAEYAFMARRCRCQH